MFGAKFGKLTVIGSIAIQEASTTPPKWKWLLRCDCGTHIIYTHDNLTRAKLQPRACTIECKRGMDYDSIFDAKFGKLNVLGLVAMRKNTHDSKAKWLCVCNCGRNSTVRTARLLNGETKTCGVCIRTGENHYAWKIDRSDMDSKMEPWVKQWRKAVYKRDGWNCQNCGKHGGNLRAHHLYSWAAYPEKRIFLENGTTMCPKCHEEFHLSCGGYHIPTTKEMYYNWTKEKYT